jgi:hypothetical protein
MVKNHLIDQLQSKFMITFYLEYYNFYHDFFKNVCGNLHFMKIVNVLSITWTITSVYERGKYHTVANLFRIVPSPTPPT